MTSPRYTADITRVFGTPPRFTAEKPLPRPVEQVASRLAESGCDLGDREACEATLRELGIADNEVPWGQWVRIVALARDLRGRRGDPVGQITGADDFHSEPL